MKLRDCWELLRKTGAGWWRNNAMRMAAALAYYAILSTAPLLVIALAVAGWVFGEPAARGEVVEQLQGLVGKQGGQAIQMMLDHASKPGKSIPAMVLGVFMLLFGASFVFAELQDSLNVIWEVTPKSGRGLLAVLRQRLLSFAMVLATGFLMLVSLLISAALSAFVRVVGLTQIGLIGHAVSFGVSFVVVTLLFATIYKVLPDVKMPWGDVWTGAVVTALLFSVGKLLIGLYLGHSSLGSTYGAAGSLVVFVVWVYYSSLILFFGAEFTRAYAGRFGPRVEPADHAVQSSPEALAQQGALRPPPVRNATQAGERR